MNTNHTPALLEHLSRLIRAIDRLPGNNPLEGLADEARAAIAAATEPQADNSEVIDRARQMYAGCGASDDIEIDSNAQVSETDDGAWVQAWVWVPNEDEDTDD